MLMAHFVTMPSAASESRFYAPTSALLRYVCLVGIFVSNAIVFVPLGQRIGVLFEALPALQAYSWDLGGSLVGTLGFGLFSLKYFSPTVGMGFVTLMVIPLLPRRQWLWGIPLLGLSLAGVYFSVSPNAFWSPYYYITVAEQGSRQFVREPHPGLRTMDDPPMYNVRVNHYFLQYHGTNVYSCWEPEEVLIPKLLF
jgi:hypothetical protein